MKFLHVVLQLFFMSFPIYCSTIDIPSPMQMYWYVCNIISNLNQYKYNLKHVKLKLFLLHLFYCIIYEELKLEMEKPRINFFSMGDEQEVG